MNEKEETIDKVALQDVLSVLDTLTESINDSEDKMEELYGFLNFCTHTMTLVAKQLVIIDPDRECGLAPVEVLVSLLTLKSYFDFRQKQPRMNDELLVDLVLSSMKESVISALSQQMTDIMARQEESHEQTA